MHTTLTIAEAAAVQALLTQLADGTLPAAKHVEGTLLVDEAITGTTSIASGTTIVAGTTLKATTGFAAWNHAIPGAQPTAITDAAGGATVDAQARTAINAVLAALRANGLIAT
jgi:hypothetical protein